jgi:hypothetical protein
MSGMHTKLFYSSEPETFWERKREPESESVVEAPKKPMSAHTAFVLAFWIVVAVPVLLLITLSTDVQGWLLALLALAITFAPTFFKIGLGIVVVIGALNYYSKAPAYVGHIIFAVAAGMLIGSWLLKMVP